jgi:hypothetical protein
MNRLLLPALALALATSVLAQADSRPEARGDAAELFRKAAAAQVEGGKPVAIRDFQAELAITVHDTDPKTKERTRRSAEVIEYYRDNGPKRPLFRRHLIDKVQGTTTIQAYDGNAFWQKLGNSPARDLTGRDSKDERARIIDEINRTKDYLRFLFLANLDGPDVKLAAGGRRTIKADGNDVEVDVVVRERPGEQPIELLIGVSKGRPLLFGFTRKTPSGKTELVTFSVHKLVKSGGITALVPLVAEYREDGVLTFEARVPRETDVKFNTNLEDRLFAIPR